MELAGADKAQGAAVVLRREQELVAPSERRRRLSAPCQLVPSKT
jgi:hypothetical protein